MRTKFVLRLATLAAGLLSAFQVHAATYSASINSLSSSTPAPNSTLSIAGSILSDSSQAVYVQYNIREIYNRNNTNIIANSALINLSANQSAPVNLNAYLPASIPLGQYRVDILVYDSAWQTLFYQNSAATFQVGSSQPAPTPAYTVSGASVSPQTINPGGAIYLTSSVGSNVDASVIVQYNVREVNNNNSVNLAYNSSTIPLTANTPVAVNSNQTLPADMPSGTYRVDVLVYKSDWSQTLLYVQAATTFSVGSVTAGSSQTFPFLIGVYEGAQNPTGITNYENWLGRKMDRILDTVPSESWDNMVTNGWSWFASQWAGNESRMIVTIPMLPTMGDYSGPSMDDATASANLASGASGAYDSYWVKMRQNLINSGYGSAMIRLGWEMNGNWYNWRASVNPTAWVSYFQRIVTILRNDPNAHFVINFNPTLGYQGIPADQVYPGDAYVDAIGVDVYDTDWNGYYPISATATPSQILAAQTAVWNNDILNDGHGLAFWSAFAKNHGKKFTIPEWGVVPSANHGGGDSTFFIQSMHDYASNPANGVTLLMYFDLPGLYGTPSAPTQFPNAAALFQKLFGP